MSKNVVFDVVGTCVSFDAYYARIDAVLGPRLREHNINPQLFGFTWMEEAELEFTFLSISGRYKPYKTIFAAMFYRTLWMAGIAEPRAFATEEEREKCIEGYSLLELRPGCKEMMALLRSEGFTVWCFTTGDIPRVRGYFERAGLDMPMENFVSSDSSAAAKPALEAYRPILKQLTAGKEEGTPWFAAAHMWDVSAAVAAGFRGAYCTVYEKDPCLEIFDTKMDVLEDSLVDMAKGIIASTQ